MPPAEMMAEYIAAVQYLWYGHTNVPKQSDYEFAWKAVKAIAAGDGALSEAERLCLLGKMCAILTPPAVVSEVLQFDARAEAPEQLLARIDVPAEVRPGAGAWIVYEGLGVAMADGDLATGERDAIRTVAARMGVAAETVDALVTLCGEEAALRTRRIELLHATIATRFRFANETEEQVRGRTRVSDG